MEKLNAPQKQERKKQKRVLALPASDPSLGEAPKIISAFTFCPEKKKQIEQAGKEYEKLKLRVFNTQNNKEHLNVDSDPDSEEEEKQKLNQEGEEESQKYN